MKPAKLPHPVHGWKAWIMADKLTQAQLLELMQAVQSDPASQNPAHAAGKSIWLYTVAARKKLDAIGWAITYQLKDRKSAAVHPAYAAPVERTQCAFTVRDL